MSMILPPDFTERVERVFGENGRLWLQQLPHLLTQCRTQWGLAIGEPFTHLRLNYIELTTTPAGEAAVLKIGPPNPELWTEMEALRLYAGRGAVRLWAADRRLGAMLLERIQPGTMLWEWQDEHQQTHTAATLMRQLTVPAPTTHSLPTFAQWVERAFHLTRTALDPTEQMPRDLLDSAEAALRHIEQQMPQRVLLHGDLHHENILLDAQQGWRIIDPKGVVGSPCLEVGRFLHNRLPPDRLAQRVQCFSEVLGYPPRLVAAAGLVDCVLSHCWCLEERSLPPGWHASLAIAHQLRQLVG